MTRSKNMPTRVTPDEYARIAAGAALDNRTVSDFVRLAALGRAERMSERYGTTDTPRGTTR